MSDQPTIYQALIAVMRDVPEIKKGDRNTFHNFTFRGVERVVNHVGPAFRTHGVIMRPTGVQLTSRDVTTEKGKTAREVTVIVDYTFTGPAGDEMPIQVPGEATDVGNSAVAKAMSVAQRIGLLQAFTIAVQQVDPETEGLERGPDPLIALKREVADIAKERGWVDGDDITRLREEYGVWSQGGDISTADVAQLTAFKTFLKPPRKMRRAQGGEQA